MQFTATVAPEGATNKAVFWDVVQGIGTGTITQEGLFTAEAPGSVQIRATSAENAAMKGTKNITVTVPAVPVTEVTVRSNGNAKTVVVAGTLQLYADVLPANADNKTVSWSSSNTAAATVNATSGLVTAKAEGTVRITATATDGSAQSGSIDLTVTPVLVSGFTVTSSPASIPLNETVTLTAGSFTPSNAALKEVTWEFVSGPDGSKLIDIETTPTSCVIQGGAVTGTVQIKVTAKDAGGFSKPHLIDVVVVEEIKVASISLSGTSCVCNDDAIRVYPSTISPSNAKNKALSWSITGGGKIQSQSGTECWIVADGSGGSITVTATATDGSDKKATYTSYGVVGLDEAGEILSAGEYEYTTWIFPNGVGQWMTKNSKYGSPDYLQAADRETPGEGGYYSNSSKTTACPDGWRLPTYEELENVYVYMKTQCSLIPSSTWWSSDRIGGSLYSSGAMHLSKYLYLRSSNSDYMRRVEKNVFETSGGSDHFVPIRCVKE
jgi:uncharacterized protein (TIGR02145 family)